MLPTGPGSSPTNTHFPSNGRCCGLAPASTSRTLQWRACELKLRAVYLLFICAVFICLDFNNMFMDPYLLYD
jgi:hypothetical protein